MIEDRFLSEYGGVVRFKGALLVRRIPELV